MSSAGDWARCLADWLDNDQPCVLLPGLPAVAEVRAWLDRYGMDAQVVDLSSLGDKSELMRAFQRDLDWPDWFGANWDALADLLSGPEDRSAPAQALVLLGWPAFEQRHPGLAETLMDIIDESSADPNSLLIGAVLIEQSG